MPRSCFICSSPFREDVDKLLLQGESGKQVAKYCCDRGLQITQQSVSRHTKHIDGYIAPKDRLHEIKSYEIERTKIVPTRFELPDDNSQLADEITETYSIIITGIKAKLIDWSRGEGRFPNDEIRSLKSYTDTIAALRNNSGFLNLESAFSSDLELLE
jgi:hypothetical protein